MKQSDALDLLKMGHNVLLLGPAGSGKTHVLKKYIEYLDKSGIPVALTASTGVAATHIGGVTIHSWSGLGIKDNLSKYDLENLSEKKYLHDRFNKTTTLIIDEISMMSAHQLDLISLLAQNFRKNSLPFGGLQVVLTGDFFQLPPISKGYQVARPIFEASCFAGAVFKVCYLDSQHRQTDKEYLKILQSLRDKTVTEEIKNTLFSRLNKNICLPFTATRLYTHNIDVDTINNKELAVLGGSQRVYEMIGKGNKNLVEGLKRSVLAPERLFLKKGARVMFVKNNFELGFVNGTVGIVFDFNRLGEPIINTSNGKKIIARTESWQITEDGKVKAEVSQLPLRLAWAITIHKSQGMSIDALEVDLSRAFVPGMGYVALSRVRTLAGLKLLGLNDKALEVDEGIRQVDDHFKKESGKLVLALAKMTDADKKNIVDRFLKDTKKDLPLKKKDTYDQTKELIEQSLMLADMAKIRKMTEETIIAHIEKLKDKYPDLDINYLKPADNRLKKILTVFKELKTDKLSPVKEKLPVSFTYKEIRLARLFLV